MTRLSGKAFLRAIGTTTIATLTMSIPMAYATTWQVNGAHPFCSNAGPGDSLIPFCNIGAGASAAIAGDTVQVSPATYREQVSVTHSGAAGLPITYAAAGPGALILGTANVSDGWSPTATNAWSRSFAPAAPPAQVFVDGVRLALAMDAASTVTGSYFYDDGADMLYVDIGGANPGVGHLVEAGVQTYGFRVAAGVSNVVVRGFTIRGQNHTGIRMFPGSTALRLEGNAISQTGVNGILVDGGVGPIDVVDNDVSQALSVGVRLSNAMGVLVQGNDSSLNGFHGFALATSAGNTLVGNRAWENVRPEIRSANGFNVSSDSDNNTLIANEAWDNQDSGFQFSGGADNNLAARNLSYNNGDHGFDTSGTTIGNRYVSNTSYGNFKDGFSVEGGAINTSLHNNIGVNNGLTTMEFQLFVDPTSVTGLNADYNLFYRTDLGGRLVRHNGIFYDTVAAYASATGQDSHGIEADPLFTDPATGDFSPSLGPAIDSADASVPGFILEDFYGRVPNDIASIANTGAGIPDFADRGAIEYIDAPPRALLLLSDHSQPVPFDLAADASRSTDDVGIVSYQFDWGDGSTTGPQAGATASHLYTVVGKYSITVTVTDGAGQQSQQSRQFNARKPKK